MITRTFPAEIEALQDALGFIEEELDNAGCSMKTSTQFLICVEEMFVNVAHYAYGGKPGSVDITFGSEGGKLYVTLADEGIAFNPLAKDDPDITLPAEEREIGGLGIFMVKQSMDEVEYERKDNKNYFTMRKII